jgi:hypothetical protein
MSGFLMCLRSPVGLVLISFLLGLVLVLITTRLQVAAYWETHPVQYQESLQLQALLKRQAEWAAKERAPNAFDKLLGPPPPKVDASPSR